MMLNSREAFQQNLNADAARLEGASDVRSEYVHQRMISNLTREPVQWAVNQYCSNKPFEA